MPVISGGAVQTGLDRRDARVVLRGTYRFTRDGGAVSSIDLLDENGKALVLPDNFVMTAASITTTTALTSAGAATVALGTSEAGKGAIMHPATAYTAAPFNADTNAVHASAIVTTPHKATGAGTKVQAAIAAAALTAGGFDVVIHGYTALD